MLKRFLSYYKPHRLIFTFDMLAALLMSLIGIVYPIVTRSMLNDLIPNRNYRMVVIAGVGLLVLYLIRMLLNYFVQYYGHIMGVLFRAVLRSYYGRADAGADAKRYVSPSRKAALSLLRPQ